MAKPVRINHVTLIVDHLEKATEFYEKELGLTPLPAFNFDYPVMFFDINEHQQLHLSEWEDTPSFRGHICMQVDDFNAIFYRMKELGVIDIRPWGKVITLACGAMQMLVRDQAGYLVELSSDAEADIDVSTFSVELYREGLHESRREEYRGFKSAHATLYHGKKKPS